MDYYSQVLVGFINRVRKRLPHHGAGLKSNEKAVGYSYNNCHTIAALSISCRHVINVAATIIVEQD